MTRPAVAVVAGRSPIDRYSLHEGYVAAVAAAGATPVIIPAGPALEPGWAIDVIERCAGVIFTGGGDLALGDTRGLQDPDPSRDEVDLALALWAIESGKRVLGICRGAQLLAVATGGTLVPDLPSAGHDGHWMEDRPYEPVHDVKAEPGSHTAEVLGSLTAVNSIHHQAVSQPGGLLCPSAWAPDGVIEAIEAPGVLGLQWHPERMVANDPRHLAPFAWVTGR